MDDAFSIDHLGLHLSFPATEENESLIAEFMKQCSDGKRQNTDLILEGREITKYMELMGKLAAIQEAEWKRTREYMRRLKVMYLVKPSITINLTALQRYMESIRVLKEAKLKMEQLKYDHLQWQIDEQKWILSMQDWTATMKREQETLTTSKKSEPTCRQEMSFADCPCGKTYQKWSPRRRACAC